MPANIFFRVDINGTFRIKTMRSCRKTSKTTVMTVFNKSILANEKYIIIAFTFINRWFT